MCAPGPGPMTGSHKIAVAIVSSIYPELSRSRSGAESRRSRGWTRTPRIKCPRPEGASCRPRKSRNPTGDETICSDLCMQRHPPPTQAVGGWDCRSLALQSTGPARNSHGNRKGTVKRDSSSRGWTSASKTMRREDPRRVRCSVCSGIVRLASDLLVLPQLLVGGGRVRRAFTVFDWTHLGRLGSVAVTVVFGPLALALAGLLMRIGPRSVTFLGTHARCDTRWPSLTTRWWHAAAARTERNQKRKIHFRAPLQSQVQWRVARLETQVRGGLRSRRRCHPQCAPLLLLLQHALDACNHAFLVRESLPLPVGHALAVDPALLLRGLLHGGHALVLGVALFLQLRNGPLQLGQAQLINPTPPLARRNPVP